MTNPLLARTALLGRRAVCTGYVIPPFGDPGPCGAREGELHRLGCDHERCTVCSGQFLYCDCPEEFEERKRVPFFDLWPHSHCARCDAPHPEMFHVADEAWKFYVLSLGEGDKFLCVDCFIFIAELTDGSALLRHQLTKQAEPGNAKGRTKINIVEEGRERQPQRTSKPAYNG